MRKISLSNQILLAVVLGIATGFLFGEYCDYLTVIGKAFIAIMQICVLPYIFVSLIQSFGSLDPSQVRVLARRGLILVAILWGIVFLLMTLMPLTFPQWQSSAFYSPSLLGGDSAAVDYVQLFIPANPFNALANNVVPAVTIFSILCGVVLIRVPGKQQLLSLLELTSEVLSRLALLLVKLSPIGIFALVARAAGTMYPEDIGRMEVYLIAYVVMAALLFFVVMPLLLSVVTPFGYRETMKTGRAAMLTVLLTGNLFIALPLLVENIKTLFERHHIASSESEAIARIIVPITFILPCAGQLMDILFILFAGWFANEPFGILNYLELYSAGLLTMFGSAKVAIPFLLYMFHLPTDIMEVFIVSSVITDNIKFTVEAFAVFSLSAIFAAWMTGNLKIVARRMWLRVAIIVISCTAAIALTAVFTRCILPEPRGQAHVLDAMKVRKNIENLVLTQLPPPQPMTAANHLEQIRNNGVLRVGFNASAMPFAFFNRQGELIGFDIAMANLLAEELDCRRIEFYPVDYDALALALRENRIDIAMSEISITEKRLGTMAFTNHYLELSQALVVPDYLKRRLQDDPQRTVNELSIAALVGADYERLTIRFPEPRQVKLETMEDFFEGRVKADALLTTAEDGSAWTIMYPQYDIWLPPRQYKDLIAYAVAPGDSRFVEYLNFWLALKHTNGEINSLYDYWIKGVNVEQKQPRWSLLGKWLQSARPKTER